MNITNEQIQKSLKIIAESSNTLSVRQTKPKPNEHYTIQKNKYKYMVRKKELRTPFLVCWFDKKERVCKLCT